MLLRLAGVVQHYDWGGVEFIPDLLGIDNAAHKPFAELWVGAHPNAPSTNDQGQPLDKLIADSPHSFLGTEANVRFGGKLPYLFKVLDARKMLSIQAHPTNQQAEEGFARENAAGIDLKASHRNYKDDNHKPEVHIALTDFWMLHGFRPLEEISDILQTVPEFADLMPDFGKRLQGAKGEKERKDLLRDLYDRVMRMPQEEVDTFLTPLIARLREENPTDKNQPDFWALRAADNFPLPDGHMDRGIFSVYLLNLVSLTPGQGTYQSAGTLHAYLEGVNVELMANSDNVLRGGLTPKYVDVDELMKILTFESGKPEILAGVQVSPAERVYGTPAEEFELSQISLSSDNPFQTFVTKGIDILIVLEGTVVVETKQQEEELSNGEILLLSNEEQYEIQTETAKSTLYKASIPSPK